MSNTYKIDPKVVEAAIEARWNGIEAIIRAADEKRGLREERTAEYTKGYLRIPFHCDQSTVREGWEKVGELSRLVSDWYPVKMLDQFAPDTMMPAEQHEPSKRRPLTDEDYAA